MTEWVTIRVPEPNRNDAKEIRPESATHGDCLLAGAKLLNSAKEEGFEGDYVAFMQHMEDQAAGVYGNSERGKAVDVDDLKAVAATPEDLTELRSDVLEKLNTIEEMAKEATQETQTTGEG